VPCLQHPANSAPGDIGQLSLKKHVAHWLNFRVDVLADRGAQVFCMQVTLDDLRLDQDDGRMHAG
jgi:bacillopeptidase F (M6 metalloprotease family)